MAMATRNRLGIVGALSAALLGGCGGGGGGAAPPAGPKVPTWVQGQFAAESTFAAMCVSPRTGIDPGTQKPYPDAQGTLLDELNWLRSWTNSQRRRCLHGARLRSGDRACKSLARRGDP
jgi:hypothetical protein